MIKTVKPWIEASSRS